MAIEIEVTYSGAVPGSPNLTPKAWKELLKAAGHAVGRHWIDEMLPRHFESGASRRYNYAPRQGEQKGLGNRWWRTYTGQKQKKYHHTLPLVLTGELRASAPRGARVEVTTQHIRVRLPGARGMNRLPAEMRDELTRVTPAEGLALSVFFDNWINRRLRAIQKRTATRL